MSKKKFSEIIKKDFYFRKIIKCKVILAVETKNEIISRLSGLIEDKSDVY
jgi:hypothetical protein